MGLCKCSPLLDSTRRPQGHGDLQPFLLQSSPNMNCVTPTPKQDLGQVWHPVLFPRSPTDEETAEHFNETICPY